MTINSTHFCQVIAQDIMTTPVLTAYDTWSVKMLLDFFAQHHITGVPVINYQGGVHLNKRQKSSVGF